MTKTKRQKTDKTKPWLTAKHPEAIACKDAGRRLYDNLQKLGVKMNGVGVGITDNNQHPAIRILLTETSNQVPNNFEGYEVQSTVVGTIRAL